MINKLEKKMFKKIWYKIKDAFPFIFLSFRINIDAVNARRSRIEHYIRGINLSDDDISSGSACCISGAIGCVPIIEKVSP